MIHYAIMHYVLNLFPSAELPPDKHNKKIIWTSKNVFYQNANSLKYPPPPPPQKKKCSKKPPLSTPRESLFV